jgi:NitT/TauT family transport system substrate-binding protein
MKECVMAPKKLLISAMTLVVVLSLILAACAPAQQVQTTPLKFISLRIIDFLPMYVAQQEGFFEKHGVIVELLPVATPPERDQLILAGQADGMINEISGTLYFNQDQVQVQIVRFARAATSVTHLFSILASKQSGITSVEDLKGRAIGISDGTIIAYLTDRMLAKENFAPEDIVTTSIPSLIDRMTLLNTGQLDAATLPEPLTSLALHQGAVLLLDDSKYPEYSSSTITFRKDVLDNRPDDVRAFLAAIEDAVNAINANPEKYQDVLIEMKVVPEVLQGKFEVPKFVTAGVPTEDQFKDVLDWTISKGLMTKDLPYSDSVNPAFLP